MEENQREVPDFLGDCVAALMTGEMEVESTKEEVVMEGRRIREVLGLIRVWVGCGVGGVMQGRVCDLRDRKHVWHEIGWLGDSWDEEDEEWVGENEEEGVWL